MIRLGCRIEVGLVPIVSRRLGSVSGMMVAAFARRWRDHVVRPNCADDLSVSCEFHFRASFIMCEGRLPLNSRGICRKLSGALALGIVLSKLPGTKTETPATMMTVAAAAVVVVVVVVVEIVVVVEDYRLQGGGGGGGGGLVLVLGRGNSNGNGNG